MKPFITEAGLDRALGFQRVKGSSRTIDICAHERAWWHVEAIDNTHHNRQPTLTASLNGWTSDKSKQHHFSNERAARQWFKQNKALLPAAEEALLHPLKALPPLLTHRHINPIPSVLRRLPSHRRAFVEWFTSPFAPKGTSVTLLKTGDPSRSFHPETAKSATNLDLP